MVVNRSAFHQRLADFEAQIEDIQTSVGRLRAVAHDVETRYRVEALKSGLRRTDSGTARGGLNGNLSGFHNQRKNLDSLEFDRYTNFHLLARSLSEATNDVAVISNELRNL